MTCVGQFSIDLIGTSACKHGLSYSVGNSGVPVIYIEPALLQRHQQNAQLSKIGLAKIGAKSDEVHSTRVVASTVISKYPRNIGTQGQLGANKNRKFSFSELRKLVAADKIRDCRAYKEN